MNMSKRQVMAFLYTFTSSCFGGLIYAIFAGTEYNFAFNIMLGVVMGVFLCAMRWRERQLPKFARRLRQHGS